MNMYGFHLLWCGREWLLTFARDLDAEYDADVDMPQHGGHSQVLARQLANRRRARASVPRASPTTVVSLVHAFDEFSLDGSNRPNN